MQPVHLFVADDDLLLQRALEELLATLRTADPELDVSTHELAELEALPELRTTSLFGGRPCVVLRGKGTELRADVRAELQDYLDAPDPEAVLVVGLNGLGSSNSHLAKLAKGFRTDVSTPPDYKDAEWDDLVRREFRRLDRNADAGAVAAIREHAGFDPSAIAAKVGQVVAGTTGDVTADDVETLVDGVGKQSGFAVADALVRRDAAAALVALRGAIGAGESLPGLVGALSFRYRQLVQVRGGVDAETALGRMKWKYKEVLAEARNNFGPGELAWCIDRLARLDADLKGNSPLPSEMLVELAVIDLATPREVDRRFNPLLA